MEPVAKPAFLVGFFDDWDFMKYLAAFSIFLVILGVGLLCLGVLQSAQASPRLADETLTIESASLSRVAFSSPGDHEQVDAIPQLLPEYNQQIEEDSRNKQGELTGQKINLLQIDQQIKAEKNIPDRIVIPAIGLNAPIELAALLRVTVSGYSFDQWTAPAHFAAGWHQNSAGLGEVGNTVINGHHNDFGEVFKQLIDLKVGSTFTLYSKQKGFTYTVNNIILLQEKGATLRQRIYNARWIGQTNDERVTLVTCWPYESNSHRLIIVASPVR